MNHSPVSCQVSPEVRRHLINNHGAQFFALTKQAVTVESPARLGGLWNYVLPVSVAQDFVRFVQANQNPALCRVVG